MMTESNDTILVHLEYIKERMDAVVERLDRQNGRLTKNETALAILEDRAAEARTAGRHAGAKWGAAVGTGAAAAMAALWNQWNK